jgi:hypothetical protein
MGKTHCHLLKVKPDFQTWTGGTLEKDVTKVGQEI